MVRKALRLSGFGALVLLAGCVTVNETYTGVAPGTVLRQFPLAGHPLRRDDVIALTVVAPERTKIFREGREVGLAMIGNGGDIANVRAAFDGVAPILQQRGLMQREYGPGSLRQEIFGYPRLPSQHPGASYRRR